MGRGSRGDSRGAAQTHPPPACGCLLPRSALPPTGRGDPSRSPRTHREQPGLLLEVAAVAVGPAHPAAGTLQPSGRRREAAAGPRHPRPTRAAVTANHSSGAPRGNDRAGRGAHSGGPATAPSSYPQTRAQDSFPSHPARGKATRTFPLGLSQSVRPMSHTEINSVPLGFLTVN